MFKSSWKRQNQRKRSHKNKSSISLRNPKKSTVKNIKSSFKGLSFDLIRLIHSSIPFFKHRNRIRLFNPQSILFTLRLHILLLIFMTSNSQSLPLCRSWPTSQSKMHCIYWNCRKNCFLSIKSVEPSIELLLLGWLFRSFAVLLKRQIARIVR
jgi:hypothetical protein